MELRRIPERTWVMLAGPAFWLVFLLLFALFLWAAGIGFHLHAEGFLLVVLLVASAPVATFVTLLGFLRLRQERIPFRELAAPDASAVLLGALVVVSVAAWLGWVTFGALR